MDDYRLMRLSENQDDDAVESSDFEEEEEDFSARYRAFYDDVKVSVKEDWYRSPCPRERSEACSGLFFVKA